jgi:hypothetical protein
MIRLIVWLLALLVFVNLFRLLQVGRKIRQAKREEQAPDLPPFDSIPDAEFEDLSEKDEPPNPPNA